MSDFSKTFKLHLRLSIINRNRNHHHRTHINTDQVMNDNNNKKAIGVENFTTQLNGTNF